MKVRFAMMIIAALAVTIGLAEPIRAGQHPKAASQFDPKNYTAVVGSNTLEIVYTMANLPDATVPTSFKLTDYIFTNPANIVLLTSTCGNVEITPGKIAGSSRIRVEGTLGVGATCGFRVQVTFNVTSGPEFELTNGGQVSFSDGTETVAHALPDHTIPVTE